MVLGNLVAITQSSVRRLLAYSAIAHTGYMLVGIGSHTEQSFIALLYYAITYALTVLGAFGVVSVVEEATGGDTLSHFAGLSRRAPVPSFCMLVFMLSLAGIPPFAGFFGKFYLFSPPEVHAWNAWPALAGCVGCRDECCIALLLSEGVEEVFMLPTHQRTQRRLAFHYFGRLSCA